MDGPDNLMFVISIMKVGKWWCTRINNLGSNHYKGITEINGSTHHSFVTECPLEHLLSNIINIKVLCISVKDHGMVK